MTDANEIVESHADYLLNFAYAKVRDEELAKDLVQDTFLAALKKIDEFENRSTLRTWLTSILNRKIIDYWRKAETRYTDNLSKMGIESSDMDIFKGSETLNIDQLMERSETTEQLNHCIDQLPDKYKAAIILRYLEEKNSDEVCKELEIGASNLWVIVHRAKILLKDCMTKMSKL